jgi:hypothetical protein
MKEIYEIYFYITTRHNGSSKILNSNNPDMNYKLERKANIVDLNIDIYKI